MKLIINAQEMEFDSGVTISQILKQLKVEDKVMACAVNMNIVKQDKWDSFKPKNNDKIELLHFVGGG